MRPFNPFLSIISVANNAFCLWANKEQYTVWKVLRASLWESLDSYSSVSTVPLNLQLAPLQFAAFPNSLCLRSSAYLHVVVETVLKWLSFISTGIELFPAFRGCRPRELAGSSRTCVACMMRAWWERKLSQTFFISFSFFLPPARWMHQATSP